MDIATFLTERYDELARFYGSDRYFHTTMFQLLDAQRKVIEWHKNWPVLVEKKPEYTAADAFEPDINKMVFKMSQEIAWATEQEYIKHFGTAPPTAPILRIMAQPFHYHPDFNPDWLLPN